MALRPDPEKIIVPRRQGELLIEPGLGAMAGAAGESRKPFDKWPTREAMVRAARLHLAEAAAAWAKRIGVSAPTEDFATQRVVMTGHQVEFYHAGVWAKVVAADEVARRVQGSGAIAIDLLVDHDTVDRMGMEAPVEEEGEWRKRAVEFAEASALPADSLAAPDAETFERWDAALARCPATQTDAMAAMLTTLRRGAETEEYVVWMSRARRQFEEALGLRVHHVPTSLLCAGEVWQTFVVAWMREAAGWSAVYNRKLAEYRKAHGIKTASRPMPDLARGREGGEETCELPFWIYRTGEVRERLTVVVDGGHRFVLYGGQRLHAKDVMSDETFRIRPRALTLTMFARLFYADVFIHGIGGALYDQVTDGILEELFGEAPAYGCVSAAWLLPLGRATDPEDVGALAWRRHHVLHNPQLAIDPFTALRTDVAELITARRAAVSEIAESLRTDRRGAAAKAMRWATFKRLHAINEELHGKAPRIMGNLEAQLAGARRALEQNSVLLNREWFFGLHTMESLQRLVAAIRQHA